MIPKTIHYCWFGHNKKPELVEHCIKSWKKFCPDYEIIEWNENNFDINSNLYVKQAYENKKFAFVTDYVRLYVMYTYGGIYMDTDVEVLKSLDKFLYHEAFSGFENSTQIPTGIMAAQKGFRLFKDLLAYYDDAEFINSDGSMNQTTNVVVITNMMMKYGFIPNGKYQVIRGFALYPQNVFCPDHKKLSDKKYMKDTATIHFFAGSWKSEKVKRREKTIFWQYFIVPLSKMSHLLEQKLGKPYKHLKSVIWSPITREKNK